MKKRSKMTDIFQNIAITLIIGVMTAFPMHFTHPHFSPEELEELQRELYRLEFEKLGPSLVRIASDWFESYRFLRDSSSPFLRKRAQRKRDTVRGFLPVVYAASKVGPNADRTGRGTADL